MKLFNVVSKHGVGRKNQVGLTGFVQISRVGVVGIGAKVWIKPFNFFLPVEQQTFGHHNKCRFGFFWIKPRHQRNGLQRFTKSHVIGQTAIELAFM